MKLLFLFINLCFAQEMTPDFFNAVAIDVKGHSSALNVIKKSADIFNDNVVPIPPEDLAAFLRLNPIKYQSKTILDDPTWRYGFSVEAMKRELPLMMERQGRMTYMDKGVQKETVTEGYSIPSLVALSVDAIHKVNERISVLEASIPSTPTHTHDNKALLDSLTATGAGALFLADDGIYKAVAGGTGNVSGPASSFANRPALFADLSGKNLKDTSGASFVGNGSLSLGGNDAELSITRDGGGSVDLRPTRLQLVRADNTTFTIQPSTAQAGSMVLTFPTAPPVANQILQSDATGQLSWVNLPAGGGGNVIGPSSSVHNTIALWDGSTGTLITHRGPKIDDVNNLTGVTNLTLAASITAGGSLTAGGNAVFGGTVTALNFILANGVNLSAMGKTIETQSKTIEDQKKTIANLIKRIEALERKK